MCSIVVQGLAAFRKRDRQLFLLGWLKSSQSLNSLSLFSDATHGLRLLVFNQKLITVMSDAQGDVNSKS